MLNLVVVSDTAIRRGCGDFRRGGPEVAGRHDAGLGHNHAQDQIVSPQWNIVVVGACRTGLLCVHWTAAEKRKTQTSAKYCFYLFSLAPQNVGVFFRTWGRPGAAAAVAVWRRRARRSPERWSSAWAGAPVAGRCAGRAPTGPSRTARRSRRGSGSSRRTSCSPAERSTPPTTGGRRGGWGAVWTEVAKGWSLGDRRNIGHRVALHLVYWSYSPSQRRLREQSCPLQRGSAGPWPRSWVCHHPVECDIYIISYFYNSWTYSEQTHRLHLQ